MSTEQLTSLFETYNIFKLFANHSILSHTFWVMPASWIMPVLLNFSKYEKITRVLVQGGMTESPCDPDYLHCSPILFLPYLVSKRFGLIRVTQGQPILEISTFCWQSLELWYNTWLLGFHVFPNRDCSLLTLPQLDWGVEMYKSCNCSLLMKNK